MTVIRTFVRLISRLVDDGAVLQTPQIEHSYTSICTTADKSVYTTSTESDIEDLLIVSNQLRLRS